MNKLKPQLTSDPTQGLLQMMDLRQGHARAFFEHTGLQPDQVKLCSAVSPDGISSTWFEPIKCPSLDILSEHLLKARGLPLVPRETSTQRALIQFGAAHGIPPLMITEIKLNLSLI